MAIPHAGGNGGGGKGGKKGGKKKPPHDPPGTGGHPHPVHTGHGSHGGGGGGGGPHDPPGTGGSPHPVQTANRNEVIRKQRLLRALGYNVTVDGVWGPKSQSAWSAYVSGQRGQAVATSIAQAREQMRRRVEDIRRSQLAEMRSKIAAGREQARRMAEQRRRSLIAAQAQAILRTESQVSRERGLIPGVERRQPLVGLGNRERLAEKSIVQSEIRQEVERAGDAAMRLSGLLALEDRTRKMGVKGPRGISGAMSLGNLVDLLFDPHVGNFDPTNPRHVGVVQAFLNAHGKDVKQTGQYDEATHTALIQSFREAAAKERREQKEALIETFYKRGILEAGDLAPAWLPLGFARVPKPGELLRLLQQDSFTSAILWRALVEQLNQPQTKWLAFQEDEIMRLVGAADPQDFNLQSLRPLSELEARAFLWGSVTFNNPEGHARLRALYDATDFRDFERKVREYAKWEEYDYLQKQKIEAQQSLAWWERALNWYDKVGDEFRLWLQTEVEFMVSDPWDYLTNYDRDYNKWQREAYNDIQNAPGWLKFAQEVMVDPLMFVPVGKVGTLATKAGIGSLDAASVAAMRAAMRPGIQGTRFAEALGIAGAAGELAAFNKLWLPELRTKTIERVARGGLGASPLAMHYTWTKATRMKSVAIQAGRDSIEWSMRHGFRPVKAPLGTLGLGRGFTDWTPQDGEIRALLDASDREIREQAPAIFGENLTAWHDESLSFYQSAERAKNGESSFGAAFEGAWASRLRVMEIHRMAANYASKRVDEVLERYGAYYQDDGTLIVPKQGIAKLGEGENAKARIAEVQAQARAEGRKEYQRIIDSVGVYRRGSGNIELLEELEHGLLNPGAGDGELLDALDHRVFQLLDKLRNVLMPALQDQLEEMARIKGVRLFDAEGKWVGRNAVFQGRLKELVEKSFDPENLVKVKNPLHNVRFEYLQAKKHIESEIRRRQTRWIAWFGREIENGNPKNLSDDWLQGKLADEQENVMGHWQEVHEDGKTLFYDDREFVWESPLYAGHVDATVDVTYDDFLNDPEAWQNRIMGLDGKAIPADLKALNLGLPLAYRQGSTLDQEIGRALWALGSGHKVAPLAISQLDRTAQRGVGRFAPNAGTKKGKAEWQKMDAFRKSVTKRQVALAAAYREAYPRAMTAEWAFWHALSTAQSRPLKVIYKGLQAHLALWQFVTLPLSPMWRVRNVVDNTAKTFIEATKDPRFLFYGAAHPGSRINSVFDHNLRAMRHMVRFFDNIFGTNAEEPFVQAMETFWQQGSGVVGKVFAAHGVPVPEHLIQQQNLVKSLYDGPKNLRLLNADIYDLEKAADDIPERFITEAGKHRRLSPAEQAAEKAARSRFARFKDYAWDFMGSKPEDAARRRIYRSVYYREQKKALAAGKSSLEASNIAFTKAVDQVERVLFDYSKVTTLEDNLRIFFPFIQFWRKNSAFWIRAAVTKPWVPLTVAKFEDARQEAHTDWPEWMRRYLSAKEITDFSAQVPGLGWLVSAALPADTMYDPLNFFSFAPMWRVFKSENASLPDEKKGWSFLAPMVDAMTDIGLGLNPLVREPLESAGALNQRAWRSVFPQTPLVSALTREFLGDFFGDRVIDLDAMFADPLGAIIGGAKEFFGKGNQWASEDYDEQIQSWVQVEMINQVARGEKPDREKALQKIRGFFLVQAVVATFTGAYVRRMTKEDFYLYQLTEDVYVKGIKDYASLSNREKELLKLWGMRKADRVQFENYLDHLPLVRAYYLLPSYDEKEAFKGDHPEILPFVEKPFSARNTFPLSYVQQASLIQDTQLAFELSDLALKLDLPFETRELARQALETPALRDFWNRNDTPADRRHKHITSVYFRYLRHLSDTYFAIPEKDFDAKEDFLKRHPELQAFWNENNSEADDYKLIMQSLMADLRDRYFEFVDDDDWDSANEFLTQFPFMFDKFVGDTYLVDRETGRPSQSQHAKAYAKAKPWLDYYFSLPPADRAAWLAEGSQGAIIVKAYFDTYSSQRSGGKGGMTQHAQDYLAAKADLDFYFSLSKTERNAWLHAGSPGAKRVLAYFKRYGKNNRTARAFAADSPLLNSRNAELRNRLRFWQRYWQLTPDKRPLFVMRNAEKAGIFIYGVLGDRERHDREAEWMRKAYAAGYTVKAAHYLYVKPLLDFYFTLGKEQKALFLRANPEVEEYLDKYARKTLTGDAELDKLIERYFDLPEDSQSRSVFLRKHPEVQAYFNEKATPAERAMRRLLNVYFELPSGQEREKFLQRHPEVQEYFDKRERERRNEKMQLEAFDNADPRLAPFFDAAGVEVGGDAERMAWLLAMRRLQRQGAGEIRV